MSAMARPGSGEKLNESKATGPAYFLCDFESNITTPCNLFGAQNY